MQAKEEKVGGSQSEGLSLRRVRVKGKDSSNGSNGSKSSGEVEHEPVSPSGRVFLEELMDCVIICILTFKNAVDVGSLQELLKGTLLKHPRFSSIVELHGWQKRLTWVQVAVDMDHHVFGASLTEEEARASVPAEAYASRVASKGRFDRARPLWEAHVVNAGEGKTGGSVVFRIHHSLGDGTSLMSLLLACTRRADNPAILPSIPGQPAQQAGESAASRPAAPGGSIQLAEVKPPPSKEETGGTASSSPAGPQATPPLETPPGRAHAETAGLAGQSGGSQGEGGEVGGQGKDDSQSKRKRGGQKGGMLAALWQLLVLIWHTLVHVQQFTNMVLFVRDTKTPIRGGAGLERAPRQLATSRELPLPAVVKIGRALGGTINDALLAVVAEGLHLYLSRFNDDAAVAAGVAAAPKESPGSVDAGSGDAGSSKGKGIDLKKHIRLRGLALVNLRASPGLQELEMMMEGGSRARWGNHMGYVTLPLPVGAGLRGPIERATATKRMLDGKKTSLEALATYLSCRLIVALFGAKAAAVLTYRSLCQSTLALSNMVGPAQQVTLGGNPIESITPSVVGTPQSLTVHMQSYNGSVRFVVMAATTLIPDAYQLCRCFAEAFDTLRAAVSEL